MYSIEDLETPQKIRSLGVWLRKHALSRAPQPLLHTRVLANDRANGSSYFQCCSHGTGTLFVLFLHGEELSAREGEPSQPSQAHAGPRDSM